MNILDFIIRYLFFRGGHRVHSPFVFKLITDVVENPHGYYFYEQVPFAFEGISPHQQKLLFRLALHFKPLVLNIQSSGKERIRLCVQKASPLVQEIDSITNQLSKNSHWNMFIWTLPVEQDDLSYLDQEDRLLLVCRNIRKGKQANNQWKELKKHPLRKVSLDLGEVGILVFDSKLNREDFKSYF